ncbi:energy transducer TonB [Azonexus sp.]|uniref:energy transducer TonB n=1 Tax=Azonexus sp. TaxID=1872668 RepID=UPI0035B379C3
MLRTHRFLLPAFCVSLLIHAAPFLAGNWLASEAPPAPRPPPLQAQLQALPPVPELIVPEPPKPSPAQPATRPTTPEKHGATSSAWTQTIREQFARQQQAGLFYPAEAIRLGLEGEALVFMMLDANGNVVAARIEAGSGHDLLDQAALEAVRRLRALPADAPLEVLLPVRFRLN